MFSDIEIGDGDGNDDDIGDTGNDEEDADGSHCETTDTTDVHMTHRKRKLIGSRGHSDSLR